MGKGGVAMRVFTIYDLKKRWLKTFFCLLWTVVFHLCLKCGIDPQQFIVADYLAGYT